MSIGLIGFGVSNKAIYEHFKDNCKLTVHNYKEISLPSDVKAVFGENYLECNEDIVFRSPSVRPDKIKTDSPVFCEATYALEKLGGQKISITGSDGKTTTSSLIFEILKNKNAYLGGNIGSPLINAIGKCYDFIVSELSSFQLMDACPICDVAIITNITENHLDYHINMDEYILAKENLLKNAKHIILNYDDEILRKIGKKYRNVSYFSLNTPCDAYINNGYFCLNGKNLFSIDEIKLRGKFNLLNILASMLAAYRYVDLEEMKNAICSFSGVSNRLELVKELTGVKFYNCSIDSTPSRTVATLSAFDKSKCVVILGGSDKNLSYDILGKELKSIKSAIILGENKHKILASLNNNVKNIYIVNSLYEAVKLGYGLCKNGDNLILSPASTSFDMYSSYKERGENFRKAINNL